MIKINDDLYIALNNIDFVEKINDSYFAFSNNKYIKINEDQYNILKELNITSGGGSSTDGGSIDGDHVCVDTEARLMVQSIRNDLNNYKTEQAEVDRLQNEELTKHVEEKQNQDDEQSEKLEAIANYNAWESFSK